MQRLLDSVGNTLLERTPEELILGVFLALLLALAAAGVCSLASRKAQGTAILMALPILAVNLAAMLFAAAYVRPVRPEPGRESSTRTPVAMPRRRVDQVLVRDLAADAIARQVLVAADVDRDGTISDDEAAAASARFVALARSEAGRPLDLAAVGEAIKKRIGDVGLPPPGRHAGGGPMVEAEPAALLLGPPR